MKRIPLSKDNAKKRLEYFKGFRYQKEVLLEVGLFFYQIFLTLLLTTKMHKEVIPMNIPSKTLLISPIIRYFNGFKINLSLD